MRRALFLVVAPVLLLFAVVPALRAVAASSTDPFTKVDTHGQNAVSLELTKDGAPFAKVLILEHEMGAVNFGEGKGTLGLSADSISLRGDAVQIGVYQLEDYHDASTKAGKWIEDVDLVKGAAASATAKAGLRAGEPSFQIRLLAVKLVDR
jgi:hypothetical protein